MHLPIAAIGVAAVLAASASSPAAAEDAPAAGATTDASAKPADAKPDAAKGDAAKGDAAKSDAAKADDGKPATAKPAEVKPSGARPVTAAEQLEFQQAKVSAEMAELEQRMFHLSETLKPLEPENSSRLMLGVKFAREELIVHQMKQIQTQLRAVSLAESVIEQKQLLAKLERLEQLLLSADLDFQMRLERLRQIREVLHRLDAVIREEQRERQLSEQIAQKAAEAAAAEQRVWDIGKLIERQTTHLAQLDELPAGTAQPAPDSPQAKLLAEQAETRTATAELTPEAADPPPAEPEPLSQALADAGRAMQTAEEKLAGEKPADSQEAMQAALAALRKQEESKTQAEKLRAELDAQRFAAMARDQSVNRSSTESISEMVRGLGSSGADALGELVKAGGSMSKAETDLTARAAEPAGREQEQAVAALKYAREQLAAEAQRLQEQLRAEVKKPHGRRAAPDARAASDGSRVDPIALQARSPGVAAGPGVGRRPVEIGRQDHGPGRRTDYAGGRDRVWHRPARGVARRARRNGTGPSLRWLKAKPAKR